MGDVPGITFEMLDAAPHTEAEPVVVPAVAVTAIRVSAVAAVAISRPEGVVVQTEAAEP